MSGSTRLPAEGSAPVIAKQNIFPNRRPREASPLAKDTRRQQGKGQKRFTFVGFSIDIEQFLTFIEAFQVVAYHLRGGVVRT